jgi:hypothetical protein
MKIKKFKAKICIECKDKYLPTGSTQKYCQKCANTRKEEREKRILLKDPLYNKKDYNKRFIWKTQYNKKYQEKYPDYYKRYYKNHKEKVLIYVKNYKKTEKGKSKIRKSMSKRRSLGFILLNNFSQGYDAHHWDKKHVYYIPKLLHQSIKHNIWTGYGMDEINKAVGGWLSEDWT